MLRTVRNRRTGFTLVEVLIVVVIMAVLAATIIPQFSDSARDARVSTALFNLNTMRSIIQLYKSQHAGLTPSDTLDELISRTDAAGNVGTDPAVHVYGPYLTAIPENPFTNSRKVQPVATDTPAASGAADAGWLYNATSGNIWLDSADYITE